MHIGDQKNLNFILGLVIIFKKEEDHPTFL
jgi:hypothetical protein